MIFICLGCENEQRGAEGPATTSGEYCAQSQRHTGIALSHYRTVRSFFFFFFFEAKLVWALAYQCGGFLGSILFFGQTKTCCDNISSEIRLRRRITLKIGIRILIKKRFESAFCLLI